MTYKTQLADPRWKAKREEILERDGKAFCVRLHSSLARSSTMSYQAQFVNPFWHGL